MGGVESEVALHCDGMCGWLRYQHFPPYSPGQTPGSTAECCRVFPSDVLRLGCHRGARCLQWLRGTEHTLENGVENDVIYGQLRSLKLWRIVVYPSNIDPEYWPLLMLDSLVSPCIYEEFEDEGRTIVNIVSIFNAWAEEEGLL